MFDDFAIKRGSMELLSAWSAIEIASWDIIGKISGQPVYNLLGGASREQVRVYANGWAGRTTIEDGHATLVVEDDGPGIPAEHNDRIFEPFFTTKQDVGTGLGLWVTKGIVDRHGGSILVQSKNGNSNSSGAAFTVLLPVNADAPQPVPE